MTRRPVSYLDALRTLGQIVTRPYAAVDPLPARAAAHPTHVRRLP